MKKVLFLTLLVLLTACKQAPSAYEPPPFAFENGATAPRRVSVREIRVVDAYSTPLAKPNVEHEFPVTPESALKSWVSHRLHANPSISADSRLEVIIRDASVIETPLKKTEGVKGFFTDDQDARYDARIVVTFRLFGGGSLASVATGDVEITRYVTINEKASVFERQRIFHQLLEKMMLDFDREANARLNQYFSNVVK